MLSYEEIERKDDATTAELVSDILLEYDLLEYAQQGLLSVVTDGALSSCANSLVGLNLNSICVLHNVHRVCENVLVNLKRINPELSDELEKIDRFIVLSRRKHSRTHMRKHNIPENQRSVNVFLKVSFRTFFDSIVIRAFYRLFYLATGNDRS